MIDRRKFGRRKEDEKCSDLPRSALVLLVVIATLMVVNLVATHPIPCDHAPIRIWPLFRAKDPMQGVIKSFQMEQIQ